jgi:hypothetical protein
MRSNNWPYANAEQQKEGLKMVANQVTIRQFETACYRLVSSGFISKSFKHKIIKRLKKIINMLDKGESK